MSRVALVVLILILSVSVLAAQLKVDVALVNVVATITDRQGLYVDDFGPEDLILKEDGVVQEIAHLSQSSELPVSVGIVLDTSGSMDRKIKTATTAVERFIRTIHKDDDIFLMTFDRHPELIQDFTDNRDKLARALRGLTLGNDTALYDAVDKSLDKIKQGRHDKKAILLITDGEDTSSFSNFQQASQHVRESEVLMYCLGIAPTFDPTLSTGSPVPRIPGGGQGSPPVVIGGRNPTNTRNPGGSISLPGGIQIPIPGRRFLVEPQSKTRVTLGDVNMDVLDTFASSSGGKSWLVGGSFSGNRTSEIDKALDEIAAELRNQYSLGYYPTHPMKDGKWHHIELRAKDPKYTVRSRGDYFGG